MLGRHGWPLDRLRVAEQAEQRGAREHRLAEALRIETTVLETELALLDDRDAAVDEIMPLAEAWDRAAIAIAEGAWGIAPNDKWEQLRFCESTHNYEAISPSGSTEAPTSSTTRPGRRRWHRRSGMRPPENRMPVPANCMPGGPQPWPECGRFLE